MKSLKALVMMQLKDKIDLSFLKSKKQTLFKIIFFVLGIAVITVAMYFLLYLGQMLNIFANYKIIPHSVMVVIFTLIELVSIISCTLGLSKSLYFSADNPVLLTMPASSGIVFASKLIVYYIYELKKNITFIMPVFLAFGLLSGISFAFYPWLIFCLLFISAIPVVVGALLSIPAMWISIIFKRNTSIQIVAISLFVCGLVVGIFWLISQIPENLDLVARWGYYSEKIQVFLKDFGNFFVPFKYLTALLIGKRDGFKIYVFSIETIIIFACLLACIALIIALCFLIIKPLFLKMASKSFEYKKETTKKQIQNKKRAGFASSVVNDFKNNARNTSVLYNTIFMFFFLPLAIFLFNKILSSMNTRLLGQYMAYSFNILLILLITLSNNASIASVYSRDGLLGPLAKTRPVNAKTTLLSKLVWQTVFSCTSIIITIIIFESIMKIPAISVICFVIFALLTNVAHILWCAEMDFMKPMYQQYQTFGSNNDNPQENKATIFAFILSFVFFAVSLFLFNENCFTTWIKLCIIGVAFFSYRLYLFLKKAKLFYGDVV